MEQRSWRQLGRECGGWMGRFRAEGMRKQERSQRAHFRTVNQPFVVKNDDTVPSAILFTFLPALRGP